MHKQVSLTSSEDPTQISVNEAPVHAECNNPAYLWSVNILAVMCV